MKTTHTLTAAVLALAVLTACNADRSTDGTNSAPTAATTPTSDATSPTGDMAGTAPAPTDAATTATGNATSDAAMTAVPPPGEAMGWLVVVNEHEIAAAEQARAKKVDGKVLDYANMMHKEHTTNLEQTRALEGKAGSIATTGLAAMQRAKGEAERTRLGALDGDAYERAYIDAMVKDHAEALAMLDRIIAAPETQDPLKQHLTTTRTHVARHLEQARALQSEAGGAGNATGAGNG